MEGKSRYIISPRCNDVCRVANFRWKICDKSDKSASLSLSDFAQYFKENHKVNKHARLSVCNESNVHVAWNLIDSPYINTEKDFVVRSFSRNFCNSKVK